MAQTNYTPIILYNSGTTGNTPSTSNLASGELAINYTDGKLFYKDNSSTLQVIGWKTTPTTAGGTGLTSYTAGDLPYYSSGTALSKLGIGTSGYVLESNGSAPTWVAQSTLSVGSATNATNTSTTDDTSTNAVMYPVWKTATTGNLPEYVSSTKLKFNPSTGTLTSTVFSGSGASLTSIPNSALTNSSVTIGSTSVSLGSTVTSFSGLTALNFASGTNGITFNNSGATTNSLLNDYEVGTWTPNQGSGLTVTGTFSSNGSYVKVGKLVTVNFRLQASTIICTSTGVLTSNLPFAVATDQVGGIGSFINGTGAIGYIMQAYSSSVYSSSAVASTNAIYASVTYFATF